MSMKLHQQLGDSSQSPVLGTYQVQTIKKADLRKTHMTSIIQKRKREQGKEKNK